MALATENGFKHTNVPHNTTRKMEATVLEIINKCMKRDKIFEDARSWL